MMQIQSEFQGLLNNRPGFGALPLQRLGMDEAVSLLRTAANAGITFFDTARLYTDSEEKIGAAFSDRPDRRRGLLIATKTMSATREGMEADLAASLAALRTGYVDLYQVHNAKSVPAPGSEVYDTLTSMKERGAVRAIGLTAHSLPVALEAARSGLYAAVQYPFSLLADDRERDLVRLCRERGVTFIAMKALAGGLITDIAAAYAFIASHPGVLPIWGVQSERELNDFLRLEADPPLFDAAMRERVAAERAALAGQFCRGCGYCLPCPQDIAIPYVARMKRLLRRSPWRQYAAKEWAGMMKNARSCIECGECAERCPYGLDTPALVADNCIDYEAFMAERGIVPGGSSRLS